MKKVTRSKTTKKKTTTIKNKKSKTKTTLNAAKPQLKLVKLAPKVPTEQKPHPFAKFIKYDEPLNPNNTFSHNNIRQRRRVA